MAVTLVIDVIDFSTFLHYDRKHSLSNREEKLVFGQIKEVFPKANTCRKIDRINHTWSSTHWSSIAISGELRR